MYQMSLIHNCSVYSERETASQATSILGLLFPGYISCQVIQDLCEWYIQIFSDPLSQLVHPVSIVGNMLIKGGMGNKKVAFFVRETFSCSFKIFHGLFETLGNLVASSACINKEEFL